jgi:hypothetical protein
MNDTKEVYYDMYCGNCKYFKKKEIDPKYGHEYENEKCEECLSQPYNEDSHKPINFEKE